MGIAYLSLPLSLYHLLDPCVSEKMAMKLYGLPMSTCTTRVMACLHEKGADFELVPVNLGTGEHKQPPFLSKNPFGQIPVLEDGDLMRYGWRWNPRHSTLQSLPLSWNMLLGLQWAKKLNKQSSMPAW